MKTIITLLLLALFVSVNAQNLVLHAGAEKTVAGNQIVSSVSIETKRLWAVGAFYQVGIGQQAVDGNSQILNPYYGALFQAPLMRSDKISFVANLRTGFVAGRFFAVVPSVETRLNLSSRTGISVGAGLRMGHPSLSAKLFIKLF